MQEITLKGGRITYYGNPAGYTENSKAIVDRIFQNDELTGWLHGHSLTPEWTDGVLERLEAGAVLREADSSAPLKSLRIWQLQPLADVRMKFIDYASMVERFGQPSPEDYQVTYDGQLGTNDLEAIYNRFRDEPPPGFTGHRFSISDVVEMYDTAGSNFYYCDRVGFQPIEFTPQAQPEMEMSL